MRIKVKFKEAAPTTFKAQFKDQDAYEARFRALQIVDERAAVKSVNGVLPDEAGAVILAPSDINAASAEDVTKINEALTFKADTVTIQSYINEKVVALQPKYIADSGGHFTSDTVEGALQEIGAELAGVNTLLGSGIQISFTLDGTTCTAIAGETWTEWVGSGYKTIENGMILSVHPYSDEGVIFLDEAGVYALSLDGNTPVHGGDKIISGGTYTSMNWGG